MQGKSAILLLIAAVFSGCDAPTDAEIPPARESAAPAAETDVRHLLADGDGSDYVGLSDKAKVELCLAIEKAIDSPHDSWYFQVGLHNFYSDPDNRHTPIAEAAAVLAAMKTE